MWHQNVGIKAKVRLFEVEVLICAVSVFFFFWGGGSLINAKCGTLDKGLEVILEAWHLAFEAWKNDFLASPSVFQTGFAGKMPFSLFKSFFVGLHHTQDSSRLPCKCGFIRAQSLCKHTRS